MNGLAVICTPAKYRLPLVSYNMSGTLLSDDA